MAKIYLASSWRNPTQSRTVETLRECGHEVYDFRNPQEGDSGFHWSEIDPNYRSWTAEQFWQALKHPIAESGFRLDWGAMQWADTGVLRLPCGRSAHLEAGYFIGAKKPLYILLAGESEAELMYKMATGIFTDVRVLGLHLGERAIGAAKAMTVPEEITHPLARAIAQMNEVTPLPDPKAVEEYLSGEGQNREQEWRDQQRQRQLAGLMPDLGTRKLRARKQHARRNRRKGKRK